MPTLPPDAIAHFMTRNPVSIGSGSPLGIAYELMRSRRFRHLPVVDAGELVGVLSDRDVHHQNSFRAAGEALTVGDAMTPSPLAVDPATPLRAVADRMVQLRCGSALIVDRDGRVTGIFTTIDALRALVTLADTSAQAA